jgi:hypothetical protein
MRRIPTKWVGVVLALGLLALTLSPAQADSILVPVDGPGNLIIPNSALPAGYAAEPVQSNAMTFASLLPTLGKHAYALFQHDGWVAGYHGWLNSNDMTYKAFLTYDFYGFKTAAGAEAASNLVLGLALGVQTPTSQNGLPSNAEVFVDSTGDYGQDLKPFVAVEIVFRVQNVLADVTGYFEGGDSKTIDDATNGSISAASSIGNWLSGQTRTVKGSVFPLFLVPVAITARWPGRRRRP